MSADYEYDARWHTRFGAWVKSYGVPQLVRDLARHPRLRVTSHAIYDWVEGRIRPDPSRAQAIVRLSRGALTLDQVYAHRLEMRILRRAEKVAAAGPPGQAHGQEAT